MQAMDVIPTRDDGMHRDAVASALGGHAHSSVFYCSRTPLITTSMLPDAVTKKVSPRYAVALRMPEMVI
jgi:hypothetical protein